MIICPGAATPPEKVPLEYTRPPNAPASYTSEYNTTGWPAGVVRVGTSKLSPGLPLGIHVVAQPWRDDIVLAALAHIEKQTGGWKMPPI